MLFTLYFSLFFPFLVNNFFWKKAAVTVPNVTTVLLEVGLWVFPIKGADLDSSHLWGFSGHTEECQKVKWFLEACELTTEMMSPMPWFVPPEGRYKPGSLLPRFIWASRS